MERRNQYGDREPDCEGGSIMFLFPVVRSRRWTWKYVRPSAPSIPWYPPYIGSDPGFPFAVIADWWMPYAEMDQYRPYAEFAILDRHIGAQYMSYTQNLVMDRGDEPTWPVTVYEADGTTAFNLTSCKVYFTAKESTAYGDTRAVFQKSSPSSGITITDASAGELTVTLESTDTSSLPPKKMRLEYDLQVIEADGTILTMTRGILVVRPDVTRAES